VLFSLQRCPKIDISILVAVFKPAAVRGSVVTEKDLHPANLGSKIPLVPIQLIGGSMAKI